ncbi:MAG TPA: DUF742 domain-containing protein [Pseudonocardiaceae bacterium]|nr:DUF742 domain-containing protein [Pseudonocardiaceae bacterium]
MAAEQQTGGHRSADDLEVGLTGARFGGAAGRRSRAAAQPPNEQDAVVAHHRRAEQPLVGQTGARFSAGLKRWRRKGPESERADSEPTGTGLRTTDLRSKITGVERQPENTPLVVEPAGVDGAEWFGWSPGDTDRETGGLVRPYFWTGGRTASRCELSLETLVSATDQLIDPTAPPEHTTILTLCAAPRSVAELAALVSIPLGVARVVLGDMAEAGSVVVHRTVGSADAFPDIVLMQRVLNGLQQL